jgi:hypothetical protein
MTIPRIKNNQNKIFRLSRWVLTRILVVVDGTVVVGDNEGDVDGEAVGIKVRTIAPFPPGG